jgi:hypothetical protein
MEQKWNDTDNSKLKDPEKNFPHAILFTTKPIQTTLGANMGFHSEKLVTNYQNYGTAPFNIYK